MNQTAQLSVYFDGLCPLCSREIEYYRKKPGSESIDWVDITANGFDAAKEGLDPDRVHAVFHVKNARGQIVSGVDAFIEIWKTIPSLNGWVKLTHLPGSRAVMKLGYFIFAKVRPYLPRKTRSGEGCETEACAPRKVK